MSLILSTVKVIPKQLERFNTVKVSKKLVSKLKTIPVINSSKYDSASKNIRYKYNNILISNVLSVSKSLLISEDNKEEEKNLDNVNYKYPYKPLYFYNIDNNINGKKIIFLSKKKSFQKNVSFISNTKKKSNINKSVENNTSTFKSSKDTSFMNNLFNNTSNKTINYNFINKKTKPNKIVRKNLLKNKNINFLYSLNCSGCEKEITKDFKNSINVNEKFFLAFIDNINTDNYNIIKCKEKLRQYFSDNDTFDIHSSCFKELLDNYTWQENENYFSDFYSTKINKFSTKTPLNITVKINSLQLLFCEIKNVNNNINIINKNNKERLVLNTKIKFPFQFLPFFYGLKNDEFINLLTALIDYDFTKNIFYITNSIFIEKIEESKTLYDFFTENNFAFNNDLNKAKEYFIYDWDVKDKNNKIKHFKLKILLPRMKIRINCYNKTKIKFYKNISIKTMDDLIKYSFNEWDLFILINFSEHKIFRFEINKILCHKYSKENNSYLNNTFDNPKYNNSINFNLTDPIVKKNTIRRNDSSYSFFYTLFNENKKTNNEAYFINFILPKISISYNNLINNFNKEFEVGLKKIHHLNKLRKYFYQEDLIKFSMIIKNANHNPDDDDKLGNNNTKNFQHRASFYKRKSSAVDFADKRKSLTVRQYLKKKVTTKKKLINKLSNLSHSNSITINNSLPNIPKKLEIIKDINLNLEPYIFNFDESILKFIDFKDIHKNDSKDDSKTDKFIIDIGCLELSWTDKEGLSNNYQFNKKISEYLLDFPQLKWKNYVEKNLERIIFGKSDENKNIKQIFFNN